MLKTFHNDEFKIELSIEDSYNICKDIFLSDNWNIVENSPIKLSFKEKISLGKCPFFVELFLVKESINSTKIKIQVSVIGKGPYVKKILNNLTKDFIYRLNNKKDGKKVNYS
ncbi:MAG: hypothetical protein ACK4IX_03200, partial [Candidatus Sericytochromatia bacterium]